MDNYKVVVKYGSDIDITYKIGLEIDNKAFAIYKADSLKYDGESLLMYFDNKYMGCITTTYENIETDKGIKIPYF